MIKMIGITVALITCFILGYIPPAKALDCPNGKRGKIADGKLVVVCAPGNTDILSGDMYQNRTRTEIEDLKKKHPERFVRPAKPIPTVRPDERLKIDK